MQLYQVFDHFYNTKNDRSWWPLPPDNSESISLMMAAVRMSGMMEDCKTPADIQEAVQHTLSLLNCGVFSTEEWAAESQRVDNDMDEWADSVALTQR